MFMIPIISFPARILRLLDANVSAQEIASGVCLGMFMGFIPLNGPMTIILVLFFLFFKLNRMSTILTLPVFKLFYISGVYKLTDLLGGIVLIDAEFLTRFWRIVTHLPVLAYLDLNNTLVAGGLVLSLILLVPVFFLSAVVAGKMQSVYVERIRKLAFVQVVKKLPIISQAISILTKLREAK